MKNFFRVFSFGEKLGLYVPLYAIFTLLGVVFSAFNLALLIPLLDILFDKVDTQPVFIAPENKLSIEYGLYLFKSEFSRIVLEGGKSSALVFVCLTIASSVFLTNLFRYVANVFTSRIKTDILRNIRMQLFDKISNLHLGFFTNERKGDLISRISNDVQEIDGSVLNAIKSLFKEPLTIIVYFIVLFMISFKLTLITLIILPVGGFLLSFIVRMLKSEARESQRSLGRIINILDETVSGMRIVKAFNARRKMVGRMLEETNFYRKLSFSISLKRELGSPVSEFIGVGVVVAILFFGGNMILEGEGALEASAFMSYLAIYSQIIPPGKAFSGGIANLQKGLASAERVFEMIDIQPRVRNHPQAVALEHFKEKIEFDKVEFSYGEEKVLKDISFEVPRGTTVALVGASGAGKSTLADLLPRFYDITGGDIKIDGTSINMYEVDSLRSHIGIVTQESILFNDTVINNIRFGKEDATEEEVIRAAKIANAHEFIEKMEEGYYTGIGERGSRLSGGQRQRLSIARAVLKDPSILVLDEATSALDSESEHLVQEALSKLMENRTSLVIAHRLSTIQHADEIIVMDAGKIVERGTHQALLETDGVYKKLSTMQNVFIDIENNA